jgi:hypothetical protein
VLLYLRGLLHTYLFENEVAFTKDFKEDKQLQGALAQFDRGEISDQMVESGSHFDPPFSAIKRYIDNRIKFVTHTNSGRFGSFTVVVVEQL